MRHSTSLSSGFSLLELSIVLIIVALLFGSLLPGLSSFYQNAKHEEEARQQLNETREALLGFASRYGRLPCPAAPATRGIESTDPGGDCTHAWNGLLPAISLGLHPVSEQGYALDPWGNPLRYAISNFGNPACGSGPCLSRENGIRKLWNSATPPTPDLRICRAAPAKSGSGEPTECATNTTLTKDAVAVVFSLGHNAGRPPLSGDEAANIDNDRLFVSHASTPAPEEFDDQVSWISSSIFYSRLIAAGRLP